MEIINEMQTTTLKAKPRNERGTRVARALRKSGDIPVIIYGHGEPPESVSLNLRDVEKSLDRGARTLEVEVGSKKAQQYLIKAVQYDHMGSTPVHVDLARVSLDERVKVRVGIELRGVAKGVADNGVMDQHLAAIEVECLVTQIPDTLHPLVTNLEVGDSLLVKDLELPEGVVAVNDPEDKVATVRAMLEELEEVETEAGEEDVAEPERIGRVRKDEEAAKE